MLKQKYTKGEVVQALTATEVTTGRAIIPFYGLQTSGSRVLSENPAYTMNITTNHVSGFSGTGADWRNCGDYDYDLTFEKPLLVEGECVVSVTGGWAAIEDGAITCNEYMVITLYKVSGGVETSLGSDTTDQQGSKSAQSSSKVRAVMIDIPRTLFKKGDVFRLNIVQWLTYTAGSNTPINGIGQDPIDRNDTGYIIDNANTRDIIDDDDTTQLIVNLPVVVVD